jgi:hypothetical protein
MTTTGSDRRLAQPPPEPPRISSGWPRYLDAPIAKPRDTFALTASAVVALAFDLAIRSGLVGVGGALAIAVACGALAASGRLRNRQAVVLVAAAPLFGIWLVLRASAWLFPLNVIAACGLVLLATSLSAGGTIWNLSIPSVVARATQAVTQAVFGPVFLFAGGKRSRGTAGVVRGLIVAIPVLLVLGLLLASADAVFASFVRFDFGDAVGHVVLIAFGLLAMGALIRLASVEYVDVPSVRGPRLGPQEWTVVLVALNLMLGAFAVARLVALSEGGRRVIRSAGLTYAEYARSGFFQLLAAALIAILVIASVRGTAELGSHSEKIRFTALSLGVVALTLALVVSAFHRLFLYEQAFGLTMLRVYSQSAIVWVGAVLVFLGLSIAGVGASRGAERRTWVWTAAGVTALVMLFAMNVLNPESFVVRHNVAHPPTTGFDASYLVDLGDDAVPEIARHPESRGNVCGDERGAEQYTGWAAYNVARERAEDIRARVCAAPNNGAVPNNTQGG